MRFSIKLIFIWLLLFGISYSQGKWSYQNPSPTGASIFDIAVINPNDAFLVGNAGTILRTTNKGLNWTIVQNNIMNSLNGIVSVDSQKIFISGSEGLIIKSTNAGQNWTYINSGINVSLNGIFFVNSYTGYSCGDLGKIIKTTNSGNSWFEVNSGVVVNLKKIKFLDTQKGYAIGNRGTILATSNSGLNWSVCYGNQSDSLTDIAIVDSNRIFVTRWYRTWYNNGYIDNGIILYSSNEGANWSQIFPMMYGYYPGVTFLNQNTGFITTTGSFIYKTTNSGINWNPIILTDKIYYKLGFFDTLNFILTGKNSNVYKSTDSGDNWNKVLPVFSIGSYYLSNVFFYNLNTGFIAGENTPSGGLILKTTNGGFNWIIKDTGNISINKVFMVDSIRGISAGNRIIKKTTDGGNNWFIVNTSIYSLSDIYFFDSNSGFVVGGQPSIGEVLYSTDCFTSYVNRNSGVYSAMYCIDFVNQNTGFIAGMGGAIYKTTNRGINWVSQTSGTTSRLNDIQFLNVNTGYTVGQNGVFLYTTNSGNQWMPQASGVTYELFSLKFFNLQYGVATGRGGVLLSTQNGGVNWSKQFLSSNNLFGMFFHNSNSGYIVGENGLIMNTTNGGYVFVNQNPEIVPSSYSLSQNYPNPFNPTTKIKFDILESGNVKIVVYDVTGREIQTLVNERLQPGTYETTFDGSGLTSGVYFYSMLTDGYSETKKMIYMK